MNNVTVADIEAELERRVQHELNVRKARTSLSHFIRVTKPDYIFGWFNEDLCRQLEQFAQDVLDRKSPRLILQAPPRHGKSECVSVRFVAWMLGRFPWMQIINTSYADTLATGFNRQVQAIIDSDVYHEIFPDVLINGEIAKTLDRTNDVRYLKRTADFFEVYPQKGYMNSAGVGTGITGKGCHILINDDLFKDRAEADSETIREKVWDWYKSTARSRLADGGGVIVMMTRWHVDDIAGRLLELSKTGSGEHFDEICYPAIATEDEPHRKFGEALFPERYSLKSLEQIKLAVGSKEWASLYQQSPIPDGGGMFKKSWLQYYDELPNHFEKIVMAFDMTFKDTKTSDYVCGQVWIREKGCYYLVDQIRGRFDFVTTLRKFISFCSEHDYCLRKLVEDKANGTAVINMLRKHISGIIPVVPTESKIARANTVTTVWEAHNVFIPNPKKYKWVETEFEPELLTFPSGKHDDQIDCMTMCLNDLISKSQSIDPTNIEMLLKGLEI